MMTMMTKMTTMTIITTSGQRILTRGWVTGADFFTRKISVTRTMQSAAAVALMPILFFCCVHRSSDSQCFLMGRTTPKIPPPWGIWTPSNTWFLGLTRVIHRKRKKGKEEYLYSAFYILRISQSAQAWITQFYLQIHHACLSFVSVHQMAPFLTEVRDIQLQLTTHLSTQKGWKAELAWLVDL